MQQPEVSCGVCLDSDLTLRCAPQPTGDPDPRPRGCERCARVPATPSGAGRLRLHVPVGHMRARLTAALAACGATWEVEGHDGAGGRVYGVTTRNVSALATDLLPRLSGEELVEIRAMFEAKGTNALVADYFAARPVGTLLGRIRQSWLVPLLHEERLVMHFQPIVEAARPNLVYGYECLMRAERTDIKPVRLAFPDELLAAARDADLLFQLDLAARLAAIRAAVAHGIRESVFINFSPAAIYDPAFCLRSTIGLVKEVGLHPEQIVFEVTETERVPASTAHLREILDHYRAAGFRVALDDVGAGYSSLVLLGDVRPDFVKLDKGLTSGVIADPFRAVIAEKLIEAALQTGMAVVAEGIETAESAAWFATRGVQYLQGYYFARPAAAPPRTLAFA